MREGKQHTGSDRIHTAGNCEKPTIQFRTRLLIGLQQHPRCRGHQHNSHHEEKACERGNHPDVRSFRGHAVCKPMVAWWRAANHGGMTVTSNK